MMKTNLITLYCAVCQCYDTRIAALVQCFSNNSQPKFTDQEVLTVYIWGLMEGQRTIKGTHKLAKHYLHSWFPALPSYQAFCRRLNLLSAAFHELAAYWMEGWAVLAAPSKAFVLDSFPVILAKQSRSGRAKVAREACNKSYCASRGEWYYGIKLHALNRLQYRKMPISEAIILSSASEADIDAVKQLVLEANFLRYCELYAGRAYIDRKWADLLKETHGVMLLLTPRRERKGVTESLISDDAYSTSVSRIRQPIEGFFNWLNEKTGIQVASKVRSSAGLLVHVLGRFNVAFAFRSSLLTLDSHLQIKVVSG